jgi:hypothetical protein
MKRARRKIGCRGREQVYEVARILARDVLQRDIRKGARKLAGQRHLRVRMLS